MRKLFTKGPLSQSLPHVGLTGQSLVGPVARHRQNTESAAEGERVCVCERETGGRAKGKGKEGRDKNS